MCGICGKIDWKAKPSRNVVGRMCSLLAHRGPDAEGVWAEGAVVLGHRRLAIIDTSSAGTQPLHDHTGRFVIAFNGEIYNYRDIRNVLEKLGASFTTGTDTEVIIEAFRQWGVVCLDHFVGMFAFALWDRERRTLFLARDRLGKNHSISLNALGALFSPRRPRHCWLILRWSLGSMPWGSGSISLLITP